MYSESPVLNLDHPVTVVLARQIGELGLSRSGGAHRVQSSPLVAVGL
jgi:hypothetical protein